MAGYLSPDSSPETKKRKLFHGDFIDLTNEMESQTFNLQIDDDVELVNITSKTPETLVNTDKIINNSTNAPKMLVPFLHSINGSKVLLLDETVIKSPNQVLRKSSVQQKRPSRATVLTKVNFKNSGGKIVVEQTPLFQKSMPNVIIHDHVKIAPRKTKSKITENSSKDESKITFTAAKSFVAQHATNFLLNTNNVVLRQGTSEVATEPQPQKSDNNVVETPPETPQPAPIVLNKFILKTSSQLPKLKNNVIILSDDESEKTDAMPSAKVPNKPVVNGKPVLIENTALFCRNKYIQNGYILHQEKPPPTVSYPEQPISLEELQEDEYPSTSASSATEESSVKKTFIKSMQTRYMNILSKLPIAKDGATSSNSDITIEDVSKQSPTKSGKRKYHVNIISRHIVPKDNAISSVEPTSKESSTKSVQSHVNILSEQPEDGATPDDSVIAVEENDPLCYAEKPEDAVKSSETVEEPPCIVTPVNIKDILNEAKKPKTELKDRCECSVLQNKNLYTKGFSRSEKRRPTCLKYLHSIISSEEKKLKKMRDSQRHVSFVQCRSEPGNFLPEVVGGDPDENEDFGIEKQLKAEKCYAAALPMIQGVILDVRNEVVQMKKRGCDKEELKEKLAKPEEALKLIQKGLQLIKHWAKEKNVVKRKTREKANGQQLKVEDVASKRKRALKSTGNDDFVYETVKKRGRPPKVKKHKPKVATVKRGRGKRQLEEYNGTSDLLIVKKVDILNKKRGR